MHRAKFMKVVAEKKYDKDNGEGSWEQASKKVQEAVIKDINETADVMEDSGGIIVISRNKIITSSYAARLLNVHQNTVLNWIDKGMMKAYKTAGGRRRIHLKDLKDFAEEYEMPLANIDE